MADTTEKEEAAVIESVGKTFKVDSFFKRLLDTVTKGISSFVAFLFLLLAVGAAFGFFVVLRFPDIAPLLVILPAIFGLFAYYHRDFAVILFILLILGLIFL